MSNPASMDMDEYGEIVNGPHTYLFTAEHLLHSQQPALLAWTDGHGSHHDILIARTAACAPENAKNLQGGIRPSDLFVSVMRVGAFAFEVNGIASHPNYVAEKLGVGGVTGEELTKLINGVRMWLWAAQK